MRGAEFPEVLRRRKKGLLCGWIFKRERQLERLCRGKINNSGPRQSARAVTPTILTQLLKGDEVKIGSLEPRRDFTFVLTYGEVYSVGSNISISVKESIDKGSAS